MPQGHAKRFIDRDRELGWQSSLRLTGISIPSNGLDGTPSESAVVCGANYMVASMGDCTVT